MMLNKPTIEQLQERILAFAVDRDWRQFHNPKNLAMALSVEASELVEIFQWLTEKEAGSLTPQQHKHASEELADIFIYTIRMAQELNIDLLSATAEKMIINTEKYPAEKVRGCVTKYTHYQK